MNRKMKRIRLGLFLAAALLLALAMNAFAAMPGFPDRGIMDPRGNAGIIDGTGDDGRGGDGRIDSSPSDDGLITTVPRPDSDPSRDTVKPDTDRPGTVNPGTDRPVDTDTAVAGSSSEEGGFSWWGLVIALLIAAAVIALIVVMIPKKDQPGARR